ncbi:toll/interleukin-1 receptor domain-containing protein [Methylophilus sp. 'Pure River']|uniref:toll/interleukin-1 receptor domain-containing protein n=1 Tax=Methylophilus sp. 'Pure River' TaxID=3377117 RepID=UPI00398EA942
MPIFISYSHSNKEFVDKLAIQLVRNNVNVWMDRWELSLGDSIVDRVQEAIDGASALLVILSKASIASTWCNKELSAGFLRELEERRVVVLPVMLEDCDLPVFARGKLFADFRGSFDDGLRVVLEGIAKVTNPHLNRSKGPTFHTDWSVDWGDIEGLTSLTMTFVEQLEGQPYTCFTYIDVLADESATNVHLAIFREHGEHVAKRRLLEVLCKYADSNEDIRPILVDEKPFQKTFTVEASPGNLSLRIIARRLGEDTGRNILINTSSLIRDVFRHYSEVTKNV